MAFELSKTTDEDWIKILSDSQGDKEKYRLLNRDLKQRPQIWVIDRSKNFYLLSKPGAYIPGSTEDFRCYFFFEGGFYELTKLKLFGPEIAIIEMPPIEFLDNFKQQLAAAFAVQFPEDFIYGAIFKNMEGVA